MPKKVTLVLSLCMVMLLLSGCTSNKFEDIEDYDTGISEELLIKLGEKRREVEANPGGVFMVDEKTGYGYLQFTTGKEHELDQHVKFMDGKYDPETKTFTVRVIRFRPQTGEPNTYIGDFKVMVRFEKFSFEKLQVVVEVRDEIDGPTEEELVYDVEI